MTTGENQRAGNEVTDLAPSWDNPEISKLPIEGFRYTSVDFYEKAVALNPALIDYFENKRRRLKEAGLWNSDDERESS